MRELRSVETPKAALIPKRGTRFSLAPGEHGSFMYARIVYLSAADGKLRNMGPLP